MFVIGASFKMLCKIFVVLSFSSSYFSSSLYLIFPLCWSVLPNSLYFTYIICLISIFDFLHSVSQGLKVSFIGSICIIYCYAFTGGNKIQICKSEHYTKWGQCRESVFHEECHYFIPREYEEEFHPSLTSDLRFSACKRRSTYSKKQVYIPWLWILSVISNNIWKNSFPKA